MEALASGFRSSPSIAPPRRACRRRRQRPPRRPGDEAGFIAATASLAIDPARLQPMRDAAVVAARRATWDEVLERFEARLQDTVDALQASPAPVPVVA
jgi:hypothetical protein